MLRLDLLATRTPRLPDRRLGPLAQLTASAALHLTALMLTIGIAVMSPVGNPAGHAPASTVRDHPEGLRFVFLTPQPQIAGGGGGGGGNGQAGPIRRAQGVGSDAVTLPTRPRPSPSTPAEAVSLPPLERVAVPPSIMLDARPLASGILNQIGLLTGTGASGTSTGPGSGGGAGTGVGTGIGSGHGPGLGPGSGGGTGGGVYHPGGGVTPPRVIREVKPAYTDDALLRRLQGSVLLELVVTRDGLPSRVRVLRSLDAGGLDQQAIDAVMQWRFEPGRLAGAPVDVLVTVIVDFWLR